MDASHERKDGPALAPPPGSAESAPADLPPLRLVLQPSGASIEVTRSGTLIGRHSEADVRLPLPDVSRRHCRLLHEEGCWQVVDLHSLNGVFVNGEQVLQAPLGQGDRLRIGGFTFSLDLGEEESPLANDLFPHTLSLPSLDGLARKAS